MSDVQLQVRIEIVSHRIVPQSGKVAAYPVYTVQTLTHIPGFAYRVERRWSELRALHTQLWTEWKPQLLRSGLKAPEFWQHSYGKGHLNEKLLRRRERDMEVQLTYFAQALQLRIEAAGTFSGPLSLYHFLTKESYITGDQSTPSSPALVAGSDSESEASPQMPAAALPLAPMLNSFLKDAGNRIRLAGAGVSGIAAPIHEGLRIDPPYQGKVILTSEELQAACDATTPPTHWYQPSTGGWPSCVAVQSRSGRASCCQEWMRSPAADSASASASIGKALEVGVLSVEVLEASGLPNLDSFGLTDCYALVAFEHTVARTCTIENSLEPRWHAEAPRAFRLPIRHPHSTLYVALFDDDQLDTPLGALTLKDDDPIGRVLLQISTLRPATLIDAWWPLQHKPCGERLGVRGAVRLRLSVEWFGERTLLLHPVTRLYRSLRNPNEDESGAQLRLRHRRAEQATLYALYGAQPERQYSWAVLREYLAEVARILLQLKAVVPAARALLFWRTPVASAAVCVGWQLLTFYPRYIPSALALLAVQLLNATYAQAASAPRLLQPLPFWPLMASLAAPAGWRAIAPLDGRTDPHVGPPKRVASRRNWLADKGTTAVQSVWKGTKATGLGTLHVGQATVRAGVALSKQAKQARASVCDSARRRGRRLTDGQPTDTLHREAEGVHLGAHGGDEHESEFSACARDALLIAPPASPPTSLTKYSSGREAALAALAAMKAGERPLTPPPFEHDEALSDDDESEGGAGGCDGGSVGAGDTPADAPADTNDTALDDEAAITEVTMIYRSVRGLGGALWQKANESLRQLLPPSQRTGRRGRSRRGNAARRAFSAACSFTAALDVNALNPAAWVLGPVQVLLGDLLHRYASVHRLLTWRDGATAPLYLLLLLISFMLALVPWDVIVPFCVRWGVRLVGLGLLGPHMHHVGTLVEQLEAAKMAEEAAAKAKAVPERGDERRAQGDASFFTSFSPSSHTTDSTEGAGSSVAAEGPGSADEDDSEEAYLVCIESFRSVPRRPCLPYVQCTHSFQSLRASTARTRSISSSVI